MDIDYNSEIKQPLLEAEKNTLQVQDEIKKRNLLNTEYQWILDNYKEVDYSKMGERIKYIPFKFEKVEREFKIEQIILIHQRNVILVEYFYDHQYRNKEVDFIDFKTLDTLNTISFKEVDYDSKIILINFNEIDYVFYQETQSVYLIKLDDFIAQKKENHLIEFAFQERGTFFNAQIIDESIIMIRHFQTMYHFKLNSTLDKINVKSKVKYEVSHQNTDEYRRNLDSQKRNLFVRNEKQGFHQFHCSEDSQVCYLLTNHFIFNVDYGETIFVDRKSLERVKQLDNKYFSIKYEDIYEYVLDYHYNIYDFSNQDGCTLKKLQKLYNSSIQQIFRISTTPNYFIIFSENEDIGFTLLVFDSKTFQIREEFKNITDKHQDFIDIDTINHRIYYRDSNFTEQIKYFNYNTNLSAFNNLVPVLKQRQHLLEKDMRQNVQNYLIYKSVKDSEVIMIDLITGFKRQMPDSSYRNTINYIKHDLDIFTKENFFKIIESQFRPPSYDKIDDISCEDIPIRKNGQYIFFKENRMVQWADFKKKSEYKFESSDAFCIMHNRFHEKQYIFDQASSYRIVYYDIKNKRFESIDLKEGMEMKDYPQLAIIDEKIGYLLIQYAREVRIISLQKRQIIKDIPVEMKRNSVFIKNNYIQINSEEEGTVILFFKNQSLHKMIQIKHSLQFKNLEILESYQKEFNQTSCLIYKDKDKDSGSKVYTMTLNSFEEMFNQDLMIQPIFPAFHFELADKVLIDSSQVQLFIKGEQTMVGYFLIDINDQVIKDYREIASKSNEEIIKELQSNVSKYLKFVAGFGTGFGVFQNNLVALETLVKQLSVNDKLTVPILICRLIGESPLDFSLSNRQQKIINLILQMILKYQDHIMFNQLIDKNLCELIRQQVDLQEYFQSNLPKYEILDSSFLSQHQDEQELIEGINLDHPKDVHQKYDELFECKLNQSKEKNDSVVSIEYHLINMPITLQSKPQELMTVLSETDRSDYFENEIIQGIIKFKWNEYTKSFYQSKFYIYLIFMAAFIFDIFYSTYATAVRDEDSKTDYETQRLQQNIWIKISTKAICSIVLLYFLKYEINQIKVQGKEYFSDGWNYFDFMLIIAYTTYCILDFTIDIEDFLIFIRILVIVLSFMKLFFFLRIYDGFSFLVQMMAGVFKDLSYFLMFFIIIIFQFGMIFLVLFKAQEIDEYNGVNKVGYFLMAFRISSGDFQLDDYHTQNDGLVIITWMIWLIAVMTLNIIFMNFIIAVISESYERVMQKLVTESYKVKANMIVEREQLLSLEELNNINYFPNYIAIRRPLNTESSEAGEWQGFIKDLKYTIRTTAIKSKTDIISNLQYLQTQNQENSLKLDQSLILGDQVKSLDGQVKGLDQKVLKIQDDMEFIKNSLTQLLQK
ncbi:wd-40 repeat protein [Stylonychia lemnae]|uniref:Wd-40 repeat protein n=1 Tax=Stylonychia lemnae TaxID=5949 RepID=A0A078AR80_STYLE|nr:wd-40 repeat protein [Stylonychia lemnae]|eukprot:CDW84476.1 wd-40 repeat protein [Stylonychia lemnae]